jgi:DNA-binding transcriptional MerR regulator
MTRPLRIGQLAAQTDVSVATLRFYERRGLIPPPARTPSGYRAYTEEAVEIIRSIKRAQELGFTLKEIKALGEFRRGRNNSCGDLKKVAASKLSEIEDELARITRARKVLRGLLGNCEKSPSKLAECPLYGFLVGPPPSAVSSSRRRRG